MKKCFKCGIDKELDEFYIHKQMLDGRLNKCKECTKKDVKDNQTEYDKTEKGVIRVIYKTQTRNSKLRGHSPQKYTKKELNEWMYSNGFKELYDDWENSGFKKEMKPSVDRLDDFKPYSFSNIRLGTWADNANHQYEDVINGQGTGGLRCKSVLCLDKNKIIAEYVSFSSACRSVGYSIERSLRSGKPDRKNGFVWKYKTG
ncbi:MAG: hypothetical protein PHW89_07990 [Sulfurimonas denitrificans]|nr:hypothetical protein [Sulfurimonas denitrificans]